MNKFDYNKPRNGGYPYTNVDGFTPENSLDFLDWTRRDGITFDEPFKYDKPRNGGYPFTNVDGPTPADSTKFLNWTRRDDNDEPVPPVPPGPQAPNYLKYSSDESFMFKLMESTGGYSREKSWDGEMQYAIGNEPGEDEWHTLEFVPGWSGISVRAMDAADDGMYNIYLRAKPDSPNTHILTREDGERTKFMTDSTEGPGFLPPVTVSGNVMALFNSTDPNSATLPTDAYALSGLFEGDRNIVDASELVLPATTLPEAYEGYGCYQDMFADCESLTKAPTILPAATLASWCYGRMFYNCYSLTDAPELPATTLASDCYEMMFDNCTSLTTPPVLPAETPANDCYNCMFWGCTALTTLPRIYLTGSGDSSDNACYGMFGECSSIKISAEQGGDYQTEYLIPNLTGEDALGDMFIRAGGPFTGTPTTGTTYYTSNAVV